MLNKYANCYNIEQQFKYSIIRSVQFQTLSIDIWQLKCQQTKNDKLFLCKLFRIIKFFFHILLSKATLDSKVAPTNHNNTAFLLPIRRTFANIELFSIFFTNFFFGTNFRHQNKNNVVETISCFVGQLSKKYCVYEYYVSEHIKKYCT